MSDDDWARVASKMGQVSEAPMFIDDSPNLTMMEIRAKARRLKQRHDLKLVVIDYIQLMTSGKKVESRQLEVSEFSRQLKLLAKDWTSPSWRSPSSIAARSSATTSARCWPTCASPVPWSRTRTSSCC